MIGFGIQPICKFKSIMLTCSWNEIIDWFPKFILFICFLAKKKSESVKTMENKLHENNFFFFSLNTKLFKLNNRIKFCILELTLINQQFLFTFKCFLPFKKFYFYSTNQLETEMIWTWIWNLEKQQNVKIFAWKNDIEQIKSC